MDNYYSYPYGYTNQNTFMGQYVSSYDEVINTPAPINGTAIIFADLTNMMLYSKKNVNGTPVVQPYSLTPIYQESTKPTEEPKQENILKTIMDELKSLRSEINTIKGGSTNESK